MLLSSSIECELRRRGQGFAGAAAEPAIAILRGRVERQLRVDAARDVAYRPAASRVFVGCELACLLRNFWEIKAANTKGRRAKQSPQKTNALRS